METGKITEADVDARLDELLTLVLDTHAAVENHSREFDADAHHALARRAAAESTVLLKNEEGLLPLAAAGVRIDELVRGAQDMEKATGTDVPFERNPSALYAAARTALYRKGCKIEILGSYDPKLLYVAEWWKQLYGESEGKDQRGISRQQWI